MRHCGTRCWRTIGPPTVASSTPSPRPASIAGRPARAGAPPRPRALLRRAGRGASRTASARASAASRTPGRRSIPGSTRSAARRLPVERGGSPVAGDAWPPARRQPLSPAAQLQAHGRRDAARVRGRVPAARGQGPAAVRRRHHRRRCSTQATARAAASTSAPCRSWEWRRPSTGRAARGWRSATRSSTRRSADCWSRRRARRLRGGDGRPTRS